MYRCENLGNEVNSNVWKISLDNYCVWLAYDNATIYEQRCYPHFSDAKKVERKYRKCNIRV